MSPVSENYFSVLGARAMAGRTLQAGDAHFEGQPPAVISYSLWQRKLGGANDAVGKTLFLSDRAFSVVGIMPRGFQAPGFDLPVDVWIPFSALPAERHELMRRGSRESVSHLGTFARRRGQGTGGSGVDDGGTQDRQPVSGHVQGEGGRSQGPRGQGPARHGSSFLWQDLCCSSPAPTSRAS